MKFNICLPPWMPSFEGKMASVLVGHCDISIPSTVWYKESVPKKSYHIPCTRAPSVGQKLDGGVKSANALLAKLCTWTQGWARNAFSKRHYWHVCVSKHMVNWNKMGWNECPFWTYFCDYVVTPSPDHLPTIPPFTRHSHTYHMRFKGDILAAFSDSILYYLLLPSS